MPTNREAYFEALKLNVPKQVINFALQEVNGFSYLELTQNLDKEITDYRSFKTAIQRYVDGEMIEYIFNKTYFLSEPFYVDSHVLIPRQETEQLVIETKKLIEELFGRETVTVADVCAGSGAIGLSLKRLLPNINLCLTDISKEAIRVCRKNADDKGFTDVKYLCGNMLEPLIDSSIKVDVLVCNPPYIEDESTIDKRTWNQEPHLALLAKPNTKYYEEVLKSINQIANDKYLLAFEIGEDMEQSLTALIVKYCPNDEFFFKKDIYGKTRFLFIKHQ